MSECDTWRDLARGRQELIDQLKAENGKLKCELNFLTTVMPPPITRVHVYIPEETREYWADAWETSIQDDGTTLKLFAVGDGAAAKRERDEVLGDLLTARIYCQRCGNGFYGEHICGRGAR